MAGHTNFEFFTGALRQRGRCLGALAGTIARTVFPIFGKFVLLTAKELGKDVMEAAVPELGEVVAGKSSIRKASKSSAENRERVVRGWENKKNN